MVAVGVAMELWVIRHEWRDEMEAWALTFFGVHRLPMRPPTVKLVVEICSAVLVTLGIVGELCIGVTITYINGEIRGNSATLRSKNAELRRDSDQLLALVRQQTGDIEYKILLQGAREYVLAGERREQLIKALKPSSGQKIEIRYSASSLLVNCEPLSATPDSEDSKYLADSFIGIFRDAGWHPRPSPLVSLSSQEKGIRVEIADNALPKTRSAAEALKKAIGQTPLGDPISVHDRRKSQCEVLSPVLLPDTVFLTVLRHP